MAVTVFFNWALFCQYIREGTKMINVFGLIGLKNYSRPFLDNNVIFVLTLILKSISISLSGFYAQRDLYR